MVSCSRQTARRHSSFPETEARSQKIYNNANKIFNLKKVWSIGAMVYGAGGIGASSVETLSKDLRQKFSNPDDADYYLKGRHLHC